MKVRVILESYVEEKDMKYETLQTTLKNDRMKSLQIF